RSSDLIRRSAAALSPTDMAAVNKVTCLFAQVEPVSCEIAVVVPYVEVVWIFAERPGYRNDLFAAVAATKSGRTTIANLDAEVALIPTMILVAGPNGPSGRTILVGFIAGPIGSCFGAGGPRKSPFTHCRDQPMHWRVTCRHATP